MTGWRSLQWAVAPGQGWLWAVCVAASICAVAGPALSQDRSKPVSVSGSWAGWHIHTDLAKQFERDTEYRAGVRGGNNHSGFRDLAAGRMDVLLYTPLSVESREADLAKGFGKGVEPPVRYDFGYFVVHVVVSKKRAAIRRLTLQQLADVLSGKATKWTDIGQQGGEIRLVGEKRRSKAEETVCSNVLRGGRIRAKVTRLASDDAVAAAVARDPAALGFYLYRRQPLEDVQVVPIQLDPKTEPIAPDEAAIHEGRYPLMQELLLYHRVDASEAARAYCAYATSSHADAAAKKGFAYSSHERRAYLAEKRQRDHKAGKGPLIRVVGSPVVQKLGERLEADYVRDVELVQLQYSALGSDGAAVGAFLSGRADLLLIEGPLSDEALREHLSEWNERSPQEDVVAARATAVVVNPANQLDALTMDQLAAIFRGEVDSWETLGASGVEGDGIHCYGLRNSDPAARLFYGECVPAAEVKGMKIEKDSTDVLAKVALDAKAIGFVDYADIAGRKGYKLLAIRVAATRDRRQDVTLAAESLRTGMYPLSRRLRLFTLDRSRAEVVRLAAYAAACRSQDANPYEAPCRTAAASYESCGLIPLADEAIKRMAEDAAKEAAALEKAKKAAEGEAGKNGTPAAKTPAKKAG